MRQQLDDMAPWDTIPYFQAPREVNTTMTGLAIRIVVGDPMTVALIFAMSTGSGLVISTNPKVTVNTGIPMPSNLDPVVFLQRDLGPLVASDWYAIGPNTSQITVITVKLAKWTNGRRNVRRPVEPAPWPQPANGSRPDW